MLFRIYRNFDCGKKILDGYSPFTAEEYKVKSANPSLPETTTGKKLRGKCNHLVLHSSKYFLSFSFVFFRSSSFLTSFYYHQFSIAKPPLFFNSGKC